MTQTSSANMSFGSWLLASKSLTIRLQINHLRSQKTARKTDSTICRHQYTSRTLAPVCTLSCLKGLRIWESIASTTPKILGNGAAGSKIYQRRRKNHLRRKWTDCVITWNFSRKRRLIVLEQEVNSCRRLSTKVFGSTNHKTSAKSETSSKNARKHKNMSAGGVCVTSKKKWSRLKTSD